MKKSNEVFSLKNKVILVTGALGLIGKEISDAFAAAGANVVLADIAGEEACRKAAQSLQHRYRTHCLGIVTDISDKTSVQNLFRQTLQRYRRVDVVVHAAALDAKFDKTHAAEIPEGSFEHFPIEQWQKSLDVNATGLFLVAQEAAKQMSRQKKGNIIFVASTYSLVAPDPSLYETKSGKKKWKPVDYVATKSIVPNVTRYLAAAYGEKGIRVNAIVPHGVANHHPKEFVQRFAQKSPLRRMCDVRELRGPFVFLASDASSYMTGSLLVVDGGWTAW